ncbi:DNA cytosine methyltransferase, partial [Paraburkholderia sp.]|uniref:DNA cytosine methyltransferase n=1 Tax=Paraburkholderia sp. TaxID=1926495 RepID=UPI0025EC3856
RSGVRPRRLTPRECARLMGFPDTFRIPVSDTQAYRQFGNSVVMPVMREVARTMMPHLDAALGRAGATGDEKTSARAEAKPAAARKTRPGTARKLAEEAADKAVDKAANEAADKAARATRRKRPAAEAA